MGGICGFTGLSDRLLLGRMSGVLNYRGSEILLRDDGMFSVAVRSLNGDSSFFQKDDKLVIVHGEVYNNDHLRALVEKKGIRPLSGSDSELALHLFSEYGDRFVEKLVGPFIILLWDSQSKELLIYRDRFGQKPIYYAVLGERILFASEIKALLQYEELERRLDLKGLDFFLTYGHIPVQNTLFKGVKKPPPASRLKYYGGKVLIERYWRVDFPEPSTLMDEELWCRIIYETTMEAVKVCLNRGKAPYGILLGGIDSSMLASIIARLTTEPLMAFTATYDEEEFNEPFPKKAAESLGIELNDIHLTSKDVINILPKLAWIYDDLVADFFVSTPTFHIMGSAKEQVKTIFSGDLAGTNFWSFPPMNLVEPYRLASKMPKSIRKKIILYALSKTPPYMKQKFLQKIDRAIKHIAFSISPDVKMINWLKFYSEQELNQLYRTEIRDGNYADVNEPFLDCIKYVEYDSWRDMAKYYMNRYKIYLSTASTHGFYIPRGERICSHFSLDIELPYFDYQLIQTTQKIPLQLRMPDKYIWRKTAEKHSLLPREVVWQEKRGFACPMHNWVVGDLKDYAVEMICDSTKDLGSIFDLDSIQKTISRGTTFQVFALLMFSLWYKTYFGT